MQVPSRFVKYILPKGFIAIDGISLTVGEVQGDSFTVYLIPETLRVTTLGRRKEGDAVNIEIEAQTQVLVLCLDTQSQGLPDSDGMRRKCVGRGVVQACIELLGHRGSPLCVHHDSAAV